VFDFQLLSYISAVTMHAVSIPVKDLIVIFRYVT